MQQKRKTRGRRRNIEITIYPKNGRSARKAILRKKKRHLVVRQEVFSIGTTLPTLAQMLLIKREK